MHVLRHRPRRDRPVPPRSAAARTDDCPPRSVNLICERIGRRTTPTTRTRFGTPGAVRRASTALKTSWTAWSGATSTRAAAGARGTEHPDRRTSYPTAIGPTPVQGLGRARVRQHVEVQSEELREQVVVRGEAIGVEHGGIEVGCRVRSRLLPGCRSRKVSYWRPNVIPSARFSARICRSSPTIFPISST
jgi:hypothetical protein